MTGNRPSEKDRSQGNLGQKVAEEEKRADEEFEHMGEETKDSLKKQKEREQKK